MAFKIVNRAGVSTTTTGTSTITLGSAIAAGTAINACKFQTLATAGLSNGDKVHYLILDANGDWEIGLGTYTSSGTTLSRTLLSSSTGSLLNLSGSAQVFVIASAETLARGGMQYFSASGTFTVPEGVYIIYAEVWGAGGGGGKCTSAIPGSGGGGGGYSSGYILVTPGQTITVTVGAAGTGSTGANAGSGGTTTFDALSATGGQGGGDDGAGAGGGGNGSGGTFSLAGRTGTQCPIDMQSGGGDAPRGGLGGLTGIGGGAAAGGSAPGGGGGGGSTNGASQNGAVGGAGGVLVKW